MDSTVRWQRLTKTLFGVCLIAAPLLILTGEVIGSAVYDGDDYNRYLASIADNGSAYYAGGIVGGLGAMALIGAVIALIHLVRVRHPRFAMVAGALALIGTIGAAGMWFFSTVVEYQMAHSANPGAMAALLEQGEDAASSIPLFVAWIALSLSMLLLAGGLAWSRTVPRWMPALLALGFVLVWFENSDVLSFAASAVLAIGLGSIGALVLRSSVAEYEAGDLTVHDPSTASRAQAPPMAPVH